MPTSSCIWKSKRRVSSKARCLCGSGWHRAGIAGAGSLWGEGSGADAVGRGGGVLPLIKAAVEEEGVLLIILVVTAQGDGDGSS